MRDNLAKDKTAAPKLQLTLPEYGRIYEVIYSVLEGRANTPHACMFFAITGALILKEHHKIEARPVAGAFLLCVDPTPSIISIAKNDGGMVTSDRYGFHKAGNELEPSLERLRSVMAAGKRLLLQQNVQQLSQFTTNRAESKLLALFLRDLPRWDPMEAGVAVVDGAEKSASVVEEIKLGIPRA